MHACTNTPPPLLLAGVTLLTPQFSLVVVEGCAKVCVCVCVCACDCVYVCTVHMCLRAACLHVCTHGKGYEAGQGRIRRLLNRR